MEHAHGVCLSRNRKTLPAHELLRFCVSPAGELTPDIGNKLPGAHIWVSATNRVLRHCKTVQTGRFREFAVSGCRTLARAARNMLGLARAAGKIVLGFAKVDAALSAGRATMLVSACDGARDGRAKLARKAQAAGVPLWSFFRQKIWAWLWGAKM